MTKAQKLITRFRCDKVGHLARECRVDIWCTNCNLRGHLARNCRKRQGNSIANVTTRRPDFAYGVNQLQDNSWDRQTNPQSVNWQCRGTHGAAANPR